MSEFKLIVAGSRDFNDYELLKKSIVDMATEGRLATINVSIVSGMAKGADLLAVKFAKEYKVKLYTFPAQWERDGKRAGYMRNENMAQFSDGLLAFWDGISKGTEHMIMSMDMLNKPVNVINYRYNYMSEINN